MILTTPWCPADLHELSAFRNMDASLSRPSGAWVTCSSNPLLIKPTLMLKLGRGFRKVELGCLVRPLLKCVPSLSLNAPSALCDDVSPILMLNAFHGGLPRAVLKPVKGHGIGSGGSLRLPGSRDGLFSSVESPITERKVFLFCFSNIHQTYFKDRDKRNGSGPQPVFIMAIMDIKDSSSSSSY